MRFALLHDWGRPRLIMGRVCDERVVQTLLGSPPLSRIYLQHPGQEVCKFNAHVLLFLLFLGPQVLLHRVLLNQVLDLRVFEILALLRSLGFRV